MPSIVLDGNSYNVERHTRTNVKTAAEHTLLDGTYRKDVFSANSKFRWRMGSDHFTATELTNLIVSHDKNTTLSFTDLDGSSYTVVFEDDELTHSLNPRVPWSNRRYVLDFTIREP